MQPFDLDAYFANRSAAVNKLAEVEAASQAKQAELAEASAQKKAELGGPNWVEQLGLTPGDFLANRVNDAASLVSGATRLLGQTASLPVSLVGGAMAHDATPEDYAAYNRVLTGKATQEDHARLNQRTADNPHTILEGLKAQDEARLVARDINDNTDLTHIVNQANRNSLNEDLAQGFDDQWNKVKTGNPGQVIAGLGGLIAHAGSALAQNPSAVREYVLENAPQLFLGVAGKAGQAGMLASNVGYAVDEYQKGIENFQKKNGGQLPPEDVRQRMALQAASLAIAEEGGDLIGVGATKLVGHAGEKAGATLLQKAKNVGLGALEGAAGETPTEAYQQYMEGQVEGKDATPLEIYTAGVIGGASGAHLSGGGRALHEVLAPAGQKSLAPSGDPQVDALRTQASDTGDVTELAKVAPDQAIAALYGHSQKPDTTDEAKAQNLHKAGEIVSDLQMQRDSLAEQLATPEQKQAQIDGLKKKLDATPESKPEVRDMLQTLIGKYEERLANPPDARKAKDMQAALDTIDTQLDTAKQSHELLHQLVTAPEAAKAGELLDAAHTDAKAAERVVNLAMAAPESLDPVQVQALVDNQDSALTQPQRDYLRQFTKARQAQNALRTGDDVHNEILDGTKDNLGLSDYQTRIGSAVARGDQKTADKYMGMLQNFLASHAQKARLVSHAEGLQGQHRVERLADGSWQIQAGHLEESQRKANGAVNVNPKAKLGASIRTEARAISATTAALQAAYDTKFTPTTTATTGAANVQNAPLEGTNPGSERQAAPVQADGKAGAAGQPAGAPAAATAASVVEGARVDALHAKAKEAHAWLENPPADYTTEGAQKRVDWAKKQLPKVETAVAAANKAGDVDGSEKLADTRAALQNVIEKGEKVLEGDASLVERFGPQDATPETASPARMEKTQVDSTPVERVSDAPVAAIAVEEKTSQSTGDGSVAGQEGSAETHKAESTIPAQSSEPVSQQSDAATDSGVTKSPEAATETNSQAGSQEGLQALKDGAKHNEQFAGKKLGEIFKVMNRAAAWLQQKSTPLEKAKDISQVKPLVTMRDFLSRWTKNPALIDALFEGGLNEHEHHALLKFRMMANEWMATIEKNFIHGSLATKTKKAVSPEWRFQDPLQDFFNADGTMDENVRTAVAYGAFSWLVEATRGAARKKDDEILALFGKKPGEAYVQSQGRGALQELVANRDTAIASMGRLVVDALGFVAKEDVASQDYMGIVTQAFGSHVLRLLEAQGLVETDAFTGDVLNGYIDGLNLQPQMRGDQVQKDRAGNPIYETRHLLRVIRETDDEGKLALLPQTQSIRDAAIGSGGVLDRLVAATRPMTEATTRPIPFTQELAKRTGQEITEEQRQVLEKQSKIPHRIIPAMHKAIKALGDVAVLKAAGWRDLNGERVQAENRDAVAAQNENLENQLQDTHDLVNGHEEGQAFYLVPDVWSNFRVGTLTRNLNLQSSKLQRFSFYRPEWQAKIDMHDQNVLTNYLTAVAQALGEKVDQLGNAKSRAKVEAMLQDPENQFTLLARKLQAAIAADTALAPADQAAVGEFAASKEGMQTLQALVSAGEYLAAKDKGGRHFVTHMLVGVDGKANGPMLTIAALGADDNGTDLFKFLNRGGFYSEADGVTNYSQWYGPHDGENHQDLYEDVAGKILGALNLKDDGVRKGLQALSIITKNLLTNVIDGAVTSAGRKLAKTPQTAFNFGAAIQKGIQDMQDSILQAIFDRIETLASDDKPGFTREELVAAVNHFIADKKQQIPADTSVEKLLDKQFSLALKHQIKTAVGAFLGETVENVMQDYYKPLIERRNALNSQVRTAFNIFNQVYQDLREREMQRLMDEGEVAFNKAVDKEGNAKLDEHGNEIRTPLHDMTVAQEQKVRDQLKDILPLAHTAYSQKVGDLAAGLYMAKQVRSTGKQPFHTIKVQFGQEFQPNGDPDARPVVQLSTTALTTEHVDPGVAALAYFMHSFDSAVMHRSIDDTQTLNVHDEAANAADKVVQTAQAINKSLWESLVQFSPMTEAYQMLERAVTGAVKLAEKGTIEPATLAALKDMMLMQVPRALRKKIEPQNIATFVMDMAHRAQWDANRVRLEGLSQMFSVDQYTWEGGEHRVTDAEREQVAKMLEEHLANKEIAPATLEAAQALGKLFAEKKAQPAPQASETTADAEAQPEAASPFGELGTPRLKSDPQLVAFFKANPKTTVGEVIRHLYTVLKGQPDSRKSAFQLQLLQVLNRTTDKGLPVHYVTKASPRELMKSEPPANSHGWYNSQGEGIFVLSPDFVHSALIPELLLHEMTHNALVDIVHQAEKGKAPKSVIARVESLKALLKQAQDFIKDTDLAGKYKNATADIDEFLAWGMNNQNFQREVLAQIQVTTPSKQPISGWRKFVQTVMEILFHGSSKSPEEQANSAMAAFLSDTSALFAQVEQAQDRAAERMGNLSMAAPGARTFSTLDIFNALAQPQDNVSPGFGEKLQGLLGGIVNALHGPFGSFKAQLMQNTTDGELGIWFKAMMTGKAPFASAAVAAGFRISSQELFAIEQVEATVRAAMDGSEARTKEAARELTDLYQQVYQRLEQADFEKITSSPAEAQALREFVFKMEKSNGDRSDYLARFAALALGHEGFNSLLQVPTTRDGRSVKDGKTFAEKVQIVLENILGFLRDTVTSTFVGQHEDAKVKALVEQLVSIEAKQREKLANPDVQHQVVTNLEDGALNFAASVRDRVGKALAAPAVLKAKSSYVKLSATVARTVVGEHVTAVLDTIMDFHDRNVKGQQGVWAGMLTEVRGPSKIMESILRGRKRQEALRQKVTEGVSGQVKDMFANGGKDLSKEANAAITHVLMRTGAHTLLKDMNLQRLEALLADKSELAAEIATREAQLPAGVLGELAAFQAKSLAYYKATGINRSPVLMMNAHVISRMLGTPLEEQITPTQAQQMESVLEQLISLHGLAFADEIVKDRKGNQPTPIQLAHQVLQAENARTDGGNGVQFAMELAAHLEGQALERNFGGNKVLMVHGYTPEIYNPHTNIVTANEQEGRDLVARGYRKGEEVRVDPHNPVQEKRHIYVLRDGGLQPWLSGIMALTGMRAKGSEMHSGYLNPMTRVGMENAQMNAAVINARQAALQKAAQTGRTFDPRKDNQRYMAPVFNEQGEIVNWRDLMLETTKDTLLERDNRLEAVMGKLAGSVFDKATAKELNRQGIEAAKKRFDAEYKDHSASYMTVGPKSSDPELRQIWHLLPHETKQIVREVWGMNSMRIRKDEIDIMFGYRKLSLADAWDKDPAARTALQKGFTDVAELIFGDKAALRIRQGERAWQEVVKEAKDNIVIKTGTVMLGNIWSNFSLLWLRGVPIKDMVHHHIVALKGATAYLDDSKELQRLQLLQDTGMTNGKDEQIRRDILRLEDSIARNPVTKMVEAGLMPSIVDAPTEDIYSYRSLLSRKTDELKDMIHPNVRELGATLYMGPETKLYQALSRVTQLSDFVARYTLYQHLTTRTKDRMSEQDALHDASESFINYDVPSHRAIQYGNDMGVLMFTKYFMRIQRVLSKASKENPLRYYAMLGVAHFMALGPTVQESLWLKHVGRNPLHLGALNFPKTMADLASVNAEMSLIK